MSGSIVPAHLAVQAMRDSGYKNAAYAIAELIDNSIQAGASMVELLCGERTDVVEHRRRSRIFQIGVLDNGHGMTADTLRIALQFGNGTHLAASGQTGMGRFGMGLPNASISQCTRVEVWSWQDGPASALYTYLDVEQVRSRTQETIPDPVQKRLPKLWTKVGSQMGATGTLVVWSNLDRIIWRTANAIIENSEFLIGRMYRRFLVDGRTTVRLVKFDVDAPDDVVAREVLPNDPGYLMDWTSCPPPFDQTAMFKPWGGESFEARHRISVGGSEHDVVLRFSYAKEEARAGAQPGATPHGKHAAGNVGISIVRAERELDLDQAWVIKYDPTERWWGIEIEFGPGLDELFGVTNNKQGARNFAELSRLDLEALLRGRTLAQAMDELVEEDDPRAPLLEIANKIQSNLRSLRALLKQQTQGNRSREGRRHESRSPELIATDATRELQREGHRGASDADEGLPHDQRQHAIEQTLMDEGLTPDQAEQLAATTVSDGLKYVFAEANLESAAFFSVKPRGGAIVITLNTSHPAYSHLIEVLERDNQGAALEVLRERLTRASDGLKLLMYAWARYEDELPDGPVRSRAQDARTDWGRMARRFLEREDVSS